MNSEFENNSFSPSFQQNQDELTPEQRAKQEQEQLKKDPLGIGHMFDKDGQFMMPGYQKTVPDQPTEQQNIDESTNTPKKQGKEINKNKESPIIQPLVSKDVPKTEQNQPSTTPSTDQTSLSPQGQLGTEQTPQDQKQDKAKKQGQKDQPQKQEVNVDKTSSKGYIKSVSTLQPLGFVEGIKQKSDIGNVLQREAQEFQKQNQQKHVVKDDSLGLKKQPKKILEEQQKDESRIPTEGQTIDPTVSDREAKQISVKHQEQNPSVPTELNPKAKLDKASQKDSGAEMMDELPQTDPGLNLSPGPTPQNWEDKQKNREDLQDNQEEGNISVGDDYDKSLKAQHESPRVENEIYPKESTGQQTIKSTPLETLDTSSKLPDKTVEFSAEDAMKVNEGLKNRLEGQLSTQHDKLDAADEKRKTQHKQAELEHKQKVDQKNVEFTKKQETAQKDAQKQVAKERQNWKTESDKIRSEYKDSSAKERQKVDSDIQKKTEDTDKQVNQEYKKAEQRAANEKKRREKEAADEKAKAKKDADKKGFWGRLTSAVKSFFDGLRKVLNFIFDQLRKAVKAIIEGVKKLVNGLIELARKAIVTMIKAFGELLKKLVSIALAAFPKLAARINALIDKTVNAAVKVVNFLADSLKKAVSVLLDALGKVLDTILAVYQKLYNLVLDALEFIAMAILKVAQFIANLISAMVAMPQHLFWGEILNAMIGFDPTAPLPAIERTAKKGESAKDLAQNKGLMDKKKLSDQDAEFTPMVTKDDLSAETLAELLNLPEGDHEFPGAKNPLTAQDIKSLQGGIENSDQNQEAPKEGKSNPDFASMTDDDKLNYYLDQMRTQMQQPKGKGKAEGKKGDKKNAPGQELPDVAKVGPLDVGQRLSFITSQMKIGIEAWWNENKGWVIPTVIGVVLGVTALIVLTGGAAIMPVLTALMQGLTVIFGAMLVAQIAAPLKDYIVKSWNNDVQGASKSLAKAFAIGLVEIIFNYIFKGLGKLFQLIGKGAKAAMRGLKKLAQGTARFTKRLGTILLRQGKVIFQGLKKGALKGTKSVGGMMQKLGRKFRFKKLTVKRKPQKIQIWGHFNSKVLIIDFNTGNHGFRDLDDRLRKHFGLNSNNKPGRPSEIGVGQQNGVIVTDSFARKFDDLSPADQQDYLQRLLRAQSKEAREAIIRELGGDTVPAWAKGTVFENLFKQRGNINKSYKGKVKPNEEIHHKVAMETLQHPVAQKGVQGGFKINDAKSNGIKVTSYSSVERTNKLGKMIADDKGIHASHPNYNKAQFKILDKFKEKLPNYNDKQAAKFLQAMSKKLDKAITTHCKNGVKVDDLFKQGTKSETGVLEVDKFFRETYALYKKM